MARREWADKLADAQTCPQCAEQYGMGDNGDIVHVGAVVRLLHKEHARAVRIVKREIDRIKKGQYTFTAGAKDSVLNELQRVLELLQKGRA